MNNNKYIGKVIESLVRSTKIDYEKDEIHTPFSSPPFFPFPSSIFDPFPHPSSFSSYCKNIYGLNDDEVKYIWKEYRNIINDKIS
jgi:hypothetical protein